MSRPWTYLIESDASLRALERKFVETGSVSIALRLANSMVKAGYARSNDLGELDKLGSIIGVAVIKNSSVRNNILQYVTSLLSLSADDYASETRGDPGRVTLRRQSVLATSAHQVHKWLIKTGFDNYFDRIPIVRAALGISNAGIANSGRTQSGKDPAIGFTSYRWADEAEGEGVEQGPARSAIVCPEHSNARERTRPIYHLNINPYYTACPVDGLHIGGHKGVVNLYYIPRRFR